MVMKNLKFKDKNSEVACGKILCIGKNYADHAKEMGGSVPSEPIVFVKTTSSLIFNQEPVIYPDHTKSLHFEGELVLYIDRKIKNATLEEAENAIGGYAAGLDMTLRDLQLELKEKKWPWALSKCFDTSGVIGEIISRDSFNLSGTETLKTYINGEVKQNVTIDNMIFDSAFLVKYLSEKITLEKGDLIFTGTPAGVGEVVPGDKMKVVIDGIPELESEVVKEVE